MSQAETKNTSKALSRRSAIALVGVSAIATSAAASVRAAPTAAPVGELSYPELADEFAAVFERWRAMNAESQAQLNDYEARVLAATGMRFEDRQKLGEDGREEYERIRDMVSQQERPMSIFDEDTIAEINHAADTVSEKVLALPARSLADLALKARAAALINAPLWTGEEPIIDITAAAMRCLIDDVCTLAGVEALPGVDVVANEICETE